MKKILVVGSSGQLGRVFQQLSAINDQFEWVFTDRHSLDITDSENVSDCFDSGSFDVCINCAAYTAVDASEENRQLALDINEKGAANLAQACAQHKVLLFHFSTDFVFDGKHHSPYTEKSVTEAVNAYGESKLRGEKAVMSAHKQVYVLRTSWLYSEYGKNFLKTILRLGNERNRLGVVADQVGTPTYAADLAQTVIHMIEAEKSEFGLYHYSNEGVASWYDFAMAIKALDGFEAFIAPLRSDQYPTAAKRPFYSVLDKSKIKETFLIDIPYWRDSLQVCMEKLKVQS